MKDFFLRKMAKNLALFLVKNGKKSGSKFKKMAQKYLIGENGGKRKINPSANPGQVTIINLNLFFCRYTASFKS